MSRNVRNNDTTRPRKSGAARNRRLLEHRRRLMALGVPEEKVLQMDHPRIRMLIAKPKLIPNLSEWPRLVAIPPVPFPGAGVFLWGCRLVGLPPP